MILPGGAEMPGKIGDYRDERPPETRRLAHPEGGDQTDDSADEEEPAIQDFDCERGNRRNNDGGQTEDAPRPERAPNARAAMSPPRAEFARYRACSSTWQASWGIVALASFTCQ
jgi:hypothetical protein